MNYFDLFFDLTNNPTYSLKFFKIFFRVALYQYARFPCVLAIKLRTYTQTHARMTIHTHLHSIRQKIRGFQQHNYGRHVDSG